MTDRQEQIWIDDARRGDQDAFAQLVRLREEQSRSHPPQD